jgi:hypothetical protein
LQTKFIEFSNKSVLVICTTKAIYVKNNLNFEK